MEGWSCSNICSLGEAAILHPLQPRAPRPETALLPRAELPPQPLAARCHPAPRTRTRRGHGAFRAISVPRLGAEALLGAKGLLWGPMPTLTPQIVLMLQVSLAILLLLQLLQTNSLPHCSPRPKASPGPWPRHTRSCWTIPATHFAVYLEYEPHKGGHMFGSTKGGTSSAPQR